MDDLVESVPGLALETTSLRDEIAMRAMATLIAKLPPFGPVGETVEEVQGIRRGVARSAYDYADAMLEMRDAPKADR